MHKLAEKLKVDPTRSIAIAEIILDRNNSDSFNQGNAKSSTILSVKKLIRTVSADFPVEIIENVINIVINMNPKPLSKICMKLEIPTYLLDMLIAFVANDEAKIQNSIAKLTSKIMPKEVSEVMFSLHSLIIGNLTQDLEPIAKLFDVQYTFLIEIVISLFRKDNNSTRHAIFSAIDQFTEKLTNEQVIGGFNIFKNRILALSTLSMGSDIDIVGMVKVALPYFPSQKIQRLYQASKGDITSIKHILRNLCNCQVKVMMEV